MARIEIYGYSDDNVEIEEKEGNVAGCDEYGFYGSGQWGYLVASDGSIVRVAYCPGDAEWWKVELHRAGTAAFSVTQPEPGDMDEYTERATLDGDITWVRWCGKNEELAGKLAQVVATHPAMARGAELALTRLNELGLVEWEDRGDEASAMMLIVEAMAEQLPASA